MNGKRYVILVGIDFSELADRALEQALLLAARRNDAEIHALCVTTPATAFDARYALPAYVTLDEADIVASTTEHLRSHVQQRLQSFETKYPELSLPICVVSHVKLDSPAQGIAQMASDIAADMVVVGTHNRRGIERLLLGSVAEGAVRYARCPVLVIPAEPAHDEVLIDPPCAECVRARRESAGEQMWCEQHRERHGRRHTYHQTDRSGAESNFPLVNR